MNKKENAIAYYYAIKNSGFSIYDQIPKELWIPIEILEQLLNQSLIGVCLHGLALRSRSKKIKEFVCESLGFPVPLSFKKTQPRFPAQDLDVYVQKSNNLQVWNEELVPSRRYALIRVCDNAIIVKVKVVHGKFLSSLDKTKKLTRKYQAKLVLGKVNKELITKTDSPHLASHFSESFVVNEAKPTDYPRKGELLPIAKIFEKLSSLVGLKFKKYGHDQERKQGGELHRLVCNVLGYKNYFDTGRFPDILNQLLEIKLQTSKTIDLGLIKPDSLELLDIPNFKNHIYRNSDVRYALFFGVLKDEEILITHLLLITGENFFSRFPQFQGNNFNQKFQIVLPKDFF